MEVVVVIIIRVPDVMEVVFLCKGVISVSLAAAVSVVTQLMMVEECVHSTVAMCTSVGTLISVVTQLVILVQELSAWYSSNVNINGNTTFSGNSARYGDGGGVSVDSSNVYISGNTTFSGNSATYGGGVYAQYSSNVYISGNTTFSGNSARNGEGGGGVHGTVAMCTSVGTPLSVVTQRGMVEE